MIADLHIHTTASDGKLTPAQAVRRAKDNAIEVISVTDHDTVGGIDEAQKEASRLGIKFVSGIEISSRSYCDVHVLGYNIDCKNAKFLKSLENIRAMRIKRNYGIGQKLIKLGINLDIDFESDGVGRMNIAREMVKSGCVKDIPEAFEKYLGVGAKAYCSSERITPEQAVKIITASGGFASLAHPKKYLLDNRLEKLLKGLKRYGLQGLEVNYPTHSDSERAAMQRLCEKYGLLPTGGSDFHGDDDRKFSFDMDARLAKALSIE